MSTLSRRAWLRTSLAGAAALAVQPWSATAQEAAGFTLPKLPYAPDALEPHIDAKTMEIHHGKHHQTYITNLNTALAKYSNLLKKPITELMRDLNQLPVDEATRVQVRNNGGGHLNHTLFWEWMGPKMGGEPTGPLGEAINSWFGDYAKFRAAFKDAALKRFGSGWAWLVVNNGKLQIVSTANQDNPISEGVKPLLGIDVWEHAYYLKYQNRRADYVDAWWNVVNWKKVAQEFTAR